MSGGPDDGAPSGDGAPPSPAAEPVVEHDERGRRFVADLGDGREAVLHYEIAEPRALDLYHTYVPPPFRNRGIASRLAEAALEHARRHGYKVIATCPFVARYIGTHPQHRDLL